MATYPELAGRVAVVTGVGRRGTIGSAIALTLARHGVQVWCADIDADAATESARLVGDEGGRSVAATVDVTDEHQVAGMVSDVCAAAGAVDILVNNAGGFHALASATDITPDQWRAVLDLNLTGAFLCSRAVLRPMTERGWGRIINITSIVGRPPTVSAPVHYAAAKAGLISLTQYLAREVGPLGITVNAVAPGTTATPRVVKLRGEEIERDLVPRIPLRRIGDPWDHAEAAAFLASDAASYITGATLDVNGGLGMT